MTHRNITSAQLGGSAYAVALVGAWLVGACGVDTHRHGLTDAASSDTPDPETSERCPPGFDDEDGTCVPPDEGRCGTEGACPKGSVCRAGEDPVCVCDPRPGRGETCTSTCTSDEDCVLEAECDPITSTCRVPSTCVTDFDCGWGERCADGEWHAWYVDGRGLLLQSTSSRRCAAPGYIEEGGPCRYSSDCSWGACSGDLPQGHENRCGRPCFRNDHCDSHEICLQLAWGPPVCSARTDVCVPHTAPELLCRLGEWVTGCRDATRCNGGDCLFPDSTSVALDYGGIGFGIGQCLAEGLCGEDEVRSAWVDENLGPTCFTRTPCWRTEDCPTGFTCLTMDAVETTWRCGYRIDS